MPQPVPYLSFKGNCADAMRFYERVLGGKLENMLTYGQSPMANECSKESLDQIMHACLVMADGNMIMGGDCPPNMPYEGIKGVSITLSYDTVAEAEKRFGALAEGGQVTMPMGPTFWAKKFGMLTDRFGTPWIVNGELVPLGK
jgi:PhnB protein